MRRIAHFCARLADKRRRFGYRRPRQMTRPKCFGSVGVTTLPLVFSSSYMEIRTQGTPRRDMTNPERARLLDLEAQLRNKLPPPGNFDFQPCPQCRSGCQLKIHSNRGCPFLQ